MGTDASKTSKDIFKIHEYISSSTPPFRPIKDLLKKQINTRPHLRIFKNKYVEERFNFNDQVPFCYQDIGISQEWLTDQLPGTEKEFDFIYVGDLSKKRRPEILIEWFASSPLRSHTLLLLSKDYASLEAKYKNYKNIIFKGPVEKKQVKEYIQKSRFGLNYIPDIEPFNELTSTKLLEYAALKTPIITTDYKWVREFEKKHGGRFFYMENDLTNFTWENINGFEYSFPDLTEWSWESQIRKSGVLEFLSSRFPHVSW
jgi:glycosyltransferase involved in cell wall biosynthesis